MKQKKQLQLIGITVALLLLAGCQQTTSESGLEPPEQEEAVDVIEQGTVEETPELMDVDPEQEADDLLADLDFTTDFDVEPDELDTEFIAERAEIYTDQEVKWRALLAETSTSGVGFEQPEQFVTCVQLVYSLARGYQNLESGTAGGYFATSQYDIRYLSDDCDTVFGVQALYLPTMLGVYKLESAERGRAIVYYYEQKQDAQRVVLAVENVQELTDDPVSPELNEMYGRALIKMGRLDDAAKALSFVVQGLDPREQWPLRLEIAELLVASGEYEQARNQYLAIAEVLSSWEDIHKVVTDQLALLYATDDHTTEIALYTQCLHALLSFDGHSIPVELEQNLQRLQAKYAGGIHADAAMKLYKQAEEQTRNDVSMRLLHVQELVDANQFQYALDELSDMKQARLPSDAMTLIAEMSKVVKEERATYIQLEKEKRVQALADQWHEGLNLLDMQMYDESIAVFSELLGTEYDRRAVQEIEKSSALAAVALRKEAASLFIKARRTQDYNGRISYLTKSRRLLQEILDKYPQVDLAEKVAVNLAVIDEQLQSMDVDQE